MMVFEKKLHELLSPPDLSLGGQNQIFTKRERDGGILGAVSSLTQTFLTGLEIKKHRTKFAEVILFVALASLKKVTLSLAFYGVTMIRYPIEIRYQCPSFVS